MKRIALLFVLVLGATTFLQAQGHRSFRGTVIRMRMADCVMQRGFMATMSGGAAPPGNYLPGVHGDERQGRVCGSGTARRAFMPLAEDTNF